MSAKKVVTVGIMSFEKFQQYTIAIAAGKYKPVKNEPKIWFESIETCMQILSTKNVELLKMIDQQKPESIQHLAELSGRKKSNLSRTLKTFQHHHLVELVKKNRKKKPVALATQFDIQVGRDMPGFLCDEFLKKDKKVESRQL